MTFNLFNIQWLDQCKPLKLTAFSIKSFNILKEANIEYEKIPKLFLNSTGRNANQYKKYLQKAILNIQPQEFHKYLSDLKKDQNCQLVQKWYLDQQQLLNSPRYWQNLYNNKQLQRLKFHGFQKMWEKSSKLSHYTSEAIVVSATKIIPVFENFCELGLLEINVYKKKLPKHLYCKFKNYLEQLQNEVTREKSILCEAMLARLKIAEKNHQMTFDDITYFILEKTSQLKLKELPLTFKPRHGLNLECYSFFIQFILQQGSAEHEKKIKKMFWCKEDDSFNVVFHANKLHIIPSHIPLSLVPRASSLFIKSFFVGHNMRANFFHERVQLMIQIRYLYGRKHNYSLDLNLILEGDIWKKIISFEGKLNQEYSVANDFLNRRWNRMFRAKTGKFLEGWKSCILQTRQKILQHKIKYAFDFSEQLKTRMAFNLDENILLSPLIKMRIQEIMQDINASLQTISLGKEDINQLHAIKNVFDRVLKYKTYNEPSDSKKNHTRLSKFTQDSQKITQQLTAQEKSIHQKIHTIMAEIIASKRFVLNETTSAELENLENLLPLYKKEDYDNSLLFWSNFFVAFLATCLEITEYNNVLDKIQVFILKHAPSYLSEKVSSIEEARKQNNTFLFQTKCRAMLFSLEGGEETALPQEKSCQNNLA